MAFRPVKVYSGESAQEKRLARSKSATLTEAELRIMNVLWERGSATVHEVLQALPAKPALAYNSVLTIVRILEKKGYVKHVKDKDNRAHVFIPASGPERGHPIRGAAPGQPLLRQLSRTTRAERAGRDEH